MLAASDQAGIGNAPAGNRWTVQIPVSEVKSVNPIAEGDTIDADQLNQKWPELTVQGTPHNLDGVLILTCSADEFDNLPSGLVKAITQDLPGVWQQRAFATLLTVIMSSPLFGGKPPKQSTIMQAIGIDSGEHAEKAMTKKQAHANLAAFLGAMRKEAK